MKTYRSEKLLPIARFYRSRHCHQRGVSLVEIMVALAISGIVLAAVLLSVASAARSSAAQTEQSAMVENGQYALNLLSRHIRNAGYESIKAVDKSPVKDRVRFGAYILGCESGIFNNATVALPDWGAACSASGSNDAIAVRYQGGQLTMLPNNAENVTGIGAGANFQALDCSGKAVTATTIGGDGNPITIVDNRFFINNNNELVCIGNGTGAGSEPMVQNIEQLRITYGVTNRLPNSAGIATLGNKTVQYMSAGYLESSAAPGENPWERVTSVRICVVVRSPNPVPSLPSHDYMNCNGVLQTPLADGFTRKALFTVVEIPNVGPGF